MVQKKIILKNLLKYALVLICFCSVTPLVADSLDSEFNYLYKADEAYQLGDVDNAYKYINQAIVISKENNKSNNDLHESILYFAQTIYSEKLKLLLENFNEEDFIKVQDDLDNFPELKNSLLKKQIAQIKLKQENPESQGQLEVFEESILDYSDQLSNIANSQHDFELNEDSGFEKLKEKYNKQGKINTKTRKSVIFSIISIIIIGIAIIILIIIVCVKGVTHQHLQEKQYIQIFKLNSSNRTKTALSTGDIMKKISNLKKGRSNISKEDADEIQKIAVYCQELGNRIDAVTGRKNNSKNVSEIVYRLSVKLGIDNVTSLIYFCAAMIYDAGFLGIDPDLLNSVSFNEEEKEAMKTHVSLTRKYLKFVPKKYISIFEDAATKHHENMDGSGYPRGLEGGEIPQIARIIRVAESFVSISSRRLYRAEVDKDTAIAKLKEQPQLYDQDVVLALEKIV